MNAKEKAKWRELLEQIAEAVEKGRPKQECCPLCLNADFMCKRCILTMLYPYEAGKTGLCCFSILRTNKIYSVYDNRLSGLIRTDTLPKLDALEVK